MSHYAEDPVTEEERRETRRAAFILLATATAIVLSIAGLVLAVFLL